MGGPDSQRRECLFGKEMLSVLCFAAALKNIRIICSLFTVGVCGLKLLCYLCQRS